MSEAQPVELSLTRDERELVRTALRLLISTLGREEADELAEAQALLARIDAAVEAGRS